MKFRCRFSSITCRASGSIQVVTKVARFRSGIPSTASSCVDQAHRGDRRHRVFRDRLPWCVLDQPRTLGGDLESLQAVLHGRHQAATERAAPDEGQQTEGDDQVQDKQGDRETGRVGEEHDQRDDVAHH